MKDLIALEKEYSLWEYKLFDYPLWIHCREPLINIGIFAERKIKRPKIISMLKSFMKTIKFLVTQYKYDKVFFLMERAELLEIYYKNKSSKKILFLNLEQERVYKGDNYISSDFFSLLRFLSRKVAFIVFRKKYEEMVLHLSKIGYANQLDKYIKIAMGDALFLKFLSLVLSKKSQKLYTGAVIPMGEKFVNALNSYEIQHGVIYPTHIGYMDIPHVRNNLILYSKRYETMMRNHGYNGKLIVDNYKKTFFEKESKRHLPIVIYTQPVLDMQEGINEFIKEKQPTNLFIQKHPKDYFAYEISDDYFVTATTPLEVEYPIIYSSSIIENFILYGKKCYIYDIKYPDANLRDFLTIYTEDIESNILIMGSLNVIYEEIQSEIACLK